MNSIMTYLAGPYSHQRASVQELRFDAHLETLATLMSHSGKVFSPIVQGHMVATRSLRGITDWTREQWMDFDLPILDHCGQLAVLTIPGWSESWGTRQEIEHARLHNKQIVMLDPERYVSPELLSLLKKAGI